MKMIIEKVSGGYIVEFFADVFQSGASPASAVCKPIKKCVFSEIRHVFAFVKDVFGEEKVNVPGI